MFVSENMSVTDNDVSSLKKQLLTNKERLGEEFLQKLFQDIEKDTIERSNSADLSHQQQLNYFLRLKSTLATVSNQRTTVRLRYFCKGEL